MHQHDTSDRRLIVLLAFLFLLIIVMGMIWRHYDNELQKIEMQQNELNPEP